MKEKERTESLSSDEGGPTQSWLIVNLDKRQYQWTHRINETLGIFWDCRLLGDPYPYHIYCPFDAIDLLTRHQLNWHTFSDKANGSTKSSIPSPSR